jgi:predicted benzoate:H+ symporter BenE
MANIKIKDSHKKDWVHLVARLVGVLVGATFLFILVSELIMEATTGNNPLEIEGAILAVLVIIGITGIVIAWRKEGIGGTIVTITAIALCVFAFVTAGRNKAFAVLVAGGPFLVTGILFLISFRKSKEMETH